MRYNNLTTVERLNFASVCGNFRKNHPHLLCDDFVSDKTIFEKMEWVNDSLLTVTSDDWPDKLAELQGELECQGIPVHYAEFICENWWKIEHYIRCWS